MALGANDANVGHTPFRLDCRVHVYASIAPGRIYSEEFGLGEHVKKHSNLPTNSVN